MKKVISNELYDIKLKDTGIFVASDDERSLVNRLEKIGIDSVGKFLEIALEKDEFRKLYTNHRFSLYKESKEIYGIYQMLRYKYLKEDSLDMIDSKYMSIDGFVYTELSLNNGNWDKELDKHSIGSFKKRFVKYHEMYKRLNLLGFSDWACKRILRIYLEKYTRRIGDKLVGIDISIKDLLLDIDSNDFINCREHLIGVQETINRIELLKQYIIESYYKKYGLIIGDREIFKRRMYLKRELKEKIDQEVGYNTFVSHELQAEISAMQEQILIVSSEGYAKKREK